jgi:hypothetical protein
MGCSQRSSSMLSRMSWSTEGVLGLGVCLVLFLTGGAEGTGVEGDAGDATAGAADSEGSTLEVLILKVLTLDVLTMEVLILKVLMKQVLRLRDYGLAVLFPLEELFLHLWLWF